MYSPRCLSLAAGSEKLKSFELQWLFGLTWPQDWPISFLESSSGKMRVDRITFKSLAVTRIRPLLRLVAVGMRPRKGWGYAEIKIATKFLWIGLEAPSALVLSPQVIELPSQPFNGPCDVPDIIPSD